MTILELLADPARWCKGHLAVDANGRTVEPTSPRACRWCLLGALEACYAAAPSVPYRALRDAVREVCEVSGGYPAWFNDAPCTTHEDILAVARKAGV